jgi:hypothetical protein
MAGRRRRRFWVSARETKRRRTLACSNEVFLWCLIVVISASTSLSPQFQTLNYRDGVAVLNVSDGFGGAEDEERRRSRRGRGRSTTR